MLRYFLKKIFFVFCFSLLLLPFFVFSQVKGETKTFFVKSSFYSQDKEEISATLQKVSQNGYFYFENSWYQGLGQEEKALVDLNLDFLANEFDQRIYPFLTSIYGFEWKPGVDNDNRVTVLFHQMKQGMAGYFNNDDEYSRQQAPQSNEREIIYLSADCLKNPLVKSYLAHEFVHLIAFNQKERLRGKEEETWFQEMLAEAAPTLLGYDSEYQNSNLQQRVKNFVASISDSLTEWQNQEGDYGVINVFFQYLLDHYGANVLADALRTSKTGIESINEALRKNGFPKDFSQIFTDWTIAIFLNDCQVDALYCYKNQALKKLKVTPSLIFLPSTQQTDVFLNYTIKAWAGNWLRVVGGEGDLKVAFEGDAAVQFKVPYVLCRDTYYCQVNFMTLNQQQKGEISFPTFGKDWMSLTLLPSVQSKTTGFDGREPLHLFSLSISMKNNADRQKLIDDLKAQIEILKARIFQLQMELVALSGKQVFCSSLENNLSLGSRGEEVKCLQEFLKSQGPDIYPEGWATGFFGSATQKAVIRFQEKYQSEILIPFGLKEGTGFVGSATRFKINQFLGSQDNGT